MEIKFKINTISDTTTEERDLAVATILANADHPAIKDVKALAKKYAGHFAALRADLNLANETFAKKVAPLSEAILNYYGECISEGMTQRASVQTVRALYGNALVEAGAPLRTVQRYWLSFVTVDKDGKEVPIFALRNHGDAKESAKVAKRAIASAKSGGCTLVDLLRAAKDADLKVGDRSELLSLIAELAPAKAAK